MSFPHSLYLRDVELSSRKNTAVVKLHEGVSSNQRQQHL